MKIAKSKSKTISKIRNVSDESDESYNGLYAATRLYTRNAKVKAIPVKEIKNCNNTIRKFSYDAQILISESEEGKVYEVASVLGVSVDKEKLEKNNGKRFIKVNKRRSDVDYNLKEQEKKNQKALNEQEKNKQKALKEQEIKNQKALNEQEKKKQKALKEQEIKNQEPLKRTVNLNQSKKSSVKRSSLSTTTFRTEKIDVLNQNTLTFKPESFGETYLNEVEKKNEEIERLKKEIELLKQPRTSYLPSSSVSTTPLANLTSTENIPKSTASFNYSYIGKITTPSVSVKTTRRAVSFTLWDIHTIQKLEESQ